MGVNKEREVEQIGDSSNMYMRDISEIPVLEAREMSRLSQTMERGKIIKTLKLALSGDQKDSSIVVPIVASELIVRKVFSDLGISSYLNPILETEEEKLKSQQLKRKKGQSYKRDALSETVKMLEIFNREGLAKALSNPMASKYIKNAILEGDSAGKKIIEGNLRLAVSVAKDYRGCGLDFVDIIQEASIGLMTAVEGYEWWRGYAFSTYAILKIKYAITRAIDNQSRSIRIPVGMLEKVRKVNKATANLAQFYSRSPSDTEIASHLDMSMEKLDKIRKAKHMLELVLSLDTSDREDEDNSNKRHNFLTDGGSPTESETLESVSRQELKKEVMELLSFLPEKQGRVLDLRFGISDGIERTLKEVGKANGITAEAARQLEKKGLTKLNELKRFRQNEL